MSYIDETLIPGENVLYRTRLHWAVMILPVLISLALVCAGIALLFDSATALEKQSASSGGMGAVGLTLIVAGGFVIGWGFWRRSSTEMAVTNKRILVKVGMVSRNTTEIMLAKIESVAVHQAILGRIFNSGTIIVRGTGGTPEPFSRINHPLEFRRKVQEQLDQIQSHAAVNSEA